ncbi:MULTISPECIES: tyrosine-type recombinase/integrase [unclassified Photobacterium]|uniref:tyrosine-type recombinase/integrase n=1 Tax=unclassified Photobacterium TaxID=2628852 RepID=UPI001EDD535E|nr:MULTISPECIES: tyrosine-type recombinase/integrase [unclassified Photobacterium]MCG3865249.1 tyrosine-type recombinase/integrase [Photobacterium sp. Ph6]MCG3876718.1 tyrosine-type recombinase/integrase [Photobacterium sp. Ph5]
MAKKVPVIDCDEKRATSIVEFSHVADSISIWQSLTHRSYAENTLVAFKNDWNHFLIFCETNKVLPLPASAETVHRFIEKMAESRKLASLKRYIVTIGLVHKCHALPNPCQSQEIKLAMHKQRLDKHDDYTHAQGFRDNHLQALLDTFALSTKPKDVRDMAIWAITFEAMLKRSEVAALRIDDIEIENSGLINITVKDRIIALSDLASKAVQRWLTLGMIMDSFVFRRIDRHSNIGDKPLDPSSIYRVFRRASQELELPADVIFSGQSPRVGASQDLADSGLSISQIQHQGRWRSPAMPAQYIGQRGKRDSELKKFAKKNTNK